MPVFETITALNCVKPCDTALALSDQQFFALVADKLATAAGIDLSEVEPGDLLTATEDGLCELLDQAPAISASPETLKALILFLASQV